jgi:hypothetical protein
VDDFISRHHPLIAAVREVVRRPGVAAMANLSGFVATADTSKSRPADLIDLYLPYGVQQIVDDAATRREHYTPRQHEILGVIKTRPKSISAAERNELFLTWQRPTKAEAAAKARNTRLSRRRGDDDDIVLEDGRTLSQHESDRASFEKQDFGDKIII